MKKILFALGATLFATAVYAACTTNTVMMPDGKLITCTTCCNGGFCTTTCM